MSRQKEVRSPARFLLKAGDALRFSVRDSLPPSDKNETAGRLSAFKARTLRVKIALSKMWEQSFFVNTAHDLFRRIFLMRARALGVLFFTCGFLQIASFFLRYSLPYLAGDEIGFLFGIVLIFLTLLFSLSRLTVRRLLIRSAVFRRFLQPLFGIEEWQLPAGESRENLLLMIALGVLLWIAGLVFTPVGVVGGISLLCLAAFVLCRPEAGLIFSALLFFFLPDSLFQGLVLLTALSFLFKCAVGRRSLAFSPLDLFVAAALSFLLYLPRTDAVFLYLSCFLLYSLSRSLLRTVSWIRRLFYAFSWVGFVSSFLLCLRSAAALFFPTLFFRYPALDALLAVQATPKTGVLFVLIFPFCFAAFSTAQTFFGRILNLITLLFLFAGICIVQNAFVWLAFFVAVVLYVLFSYRTALIGLCFGALLCVSAYFLLPYRVIGKILAFFGVPAVKNPAGQSGMQTLYGLSGWLGILLILTALALMIVSCIRTVRHAHVAALIPYVLAALCAAAAFLTVGFTAIPLGQETVAILCFAAAIPSVSRRADARERVLLPY